MSEVVFKDAGLKVIRFCGKYRKDGEDRIRFEIIRDHDEADYLSSRSMTLSKAQMAALLSSGVNLNEDRT